jgi:multidrug efflux pump subunit AcrA (membrane-fusion protein)
MKFRFKALQRQREPDELDSPLILAAPRGWVAVFVILIVMTGAAAWAVLGWLPLTVSASGLITYPQGTAPVQSLYAGMVLGVLIAPAEQVTAGEPLADVTGPDGTVRQVTSPFAGEVVSVGITSGEVVGAGSTVATIGRTGGHPGRLVAMLFVPASQAVGIAPGESAELSVSTAPGRPGAGAFDNA